MEREPKTPINSSIEVGELRTDLGQAHSIVEMSNDLLRGAREELQTLMTTRDEVREHLSVARTKQDGSSVEALEQELKVVERRIALIEAQLHEGSIKHAEFQETVDDLEGALQRKLN
jgi:hypothetical protein